MAAHSSADYSSKKDFSEALAEFTHFDLLQVNEKKLRGDWSTDRSARGENTVYDLYSKAASALADLNFPAFLAAAGRFLSDTEKKYYSLWRKENGKDYYILKATPHN